MTLLRTRPEPLTRPSRAPTELPSDLLVRRGWCQHKSMDGHGRVCLGWAVVLSSASAPEQARRARAQVYQVASEAMARKDTAKCASVAHFNDLETTTFDEVLAVVREAERRLGWREAVDI